MLPNRAKQRPQRDRAGGDVLIAACARRHGASLEYADSDFDLLEPVDEPAE